MGKKSKAANGSVVDSEDAKAFKAQAEELRKKGDELFAQSQCAARARSAHLRTCSYRRRFHAAPGGCFWASFCPH